MKIVVGKTYLDRDGNEVTVTNSGCSIYPFTGANFITLDRGGRRYTAGKNDSNDLIREVGDNFLPDKFEIDCKTNNYYNKAVQHQLGVLGYVHGGSSDSTDPVDSVADVRVGCNGGPKSWWFIHIENDSIDLPRITLDQLYDLTPPAPAVPELLIAGTSLRTVDGHVVGDSFDKTPLSTFIEQVALYLETTSFDKFGGHAVKGSFTQIQIGCQDVSKEDLQHALTWATEARDLK